MISAFRGIPASPGIVFGTVYLLKWEVPEVRHRIVAYDEIEAARVRYPAAV